MQSLKKLPKKSRITGLYLYCNKCKAYYSSDSITNCKCNSMVYRAKIHITGTKKSSKVKTLIAENFEDAIKEFLEFKKSLINSNFNLNSQLIAVHKPVLLTECMAEYMAYLNNEGVPEHMKKTRTIGHLKDYERNFKYYIDALIENGEVVQTLKFLDINAIHVGYLHKYVLNNLNAKNRYYNNIISALRLFTSYIIKTHKYENIYSNHFQGVPRRFVNYDPKAVSGVEFYKLIGAVNKENGAKILKTGERKNYYRDWIVDAFWLGLFTGGRRDEVVYLKWSDIVYDENGQPLHFNSGDNKFNRSNSNIVSNAIANASGSFFPLRVALFRIPCAALGDSEYFRRCSPVVSKMADNEDSTASLGDSEVLSVKHTPRDAIPALFQRSDNGSHISSFVR